MNDTLTFRPSYQPADVRRALARFPDASLDDLTRFRTEVGIKRAHYQHLLLVPGNKGRNGHIRAAAAWAGALEAVQDRIDAAAMTGIAKADAAGEFDLCATEKAPSMDPVDEQPAPADPRTSGPRPTSLLGMALQALRQAKRPMRVSEMLAAAEADGWKRGAGKTPDRTLQASLLRAAAAGWARKTDRGLWVAE